MESSEDRTDRHHPLREEDAVLLAASWRHLTGGDCEARAVGDELLDRWSEEHRRYHTLSHLWATLRAVDVLQEEARDVDAVRYAVWFHDAVHEGERRQDGHPEPGERGEHGQDRVVCRVQAARGEVA